MPTVEKKPGSGRTTKPADNKPDTESAGSGTVHQRLARLDDRITQEMARCHSQYDQDREALATHHGAMSKQEKGIQEELDGLRPELEEFLHGAEPGEGLTPELAKRGKRYLDLLHQQQQVRTGKRLSFGATLPAGQQPLGRPIGTEVAPPESE